jgi:apolipoprotein N-acyltransferase
VARRHATNPEKLRSDLAALRGGGADPPAGAPGFAGGRKTLVAALNLAAAALLLLSFAPYNAFFLGYIALVPWGLALVISPRRSWALLWCWIGGLVFWGAGTYWLWWITLPGYAGLILLMSGFWLLAGTLVRSAALRGVPLAAALPVVWVGLEFVRSYFMSGFPWFLLAHTQWTLPTMIQVADLGGEAAVSVVVAVVNGALLDAMSGLWRGPGAGGWLRRGISLGAAGVLVAATIGYGMFRLGQRTQAPGPIIGLVQQTYPISLNRKPADSTDIVSAHLALSRGFIGTGCELVIWPETMLPHGLNADFLALDPARVPDAELEELLPLDADEAREGLGRMLTYNRTISEAIAERSRQLQCPILAGGATIHRNDKPLYRGDRWLTRNSALWFDRGAAASTIYSKLHLVPFSEYVPFKESAPEVHKALRWFVPEVMPQLDPGKLPSRFVLAGPSGTYVIATPICYEGVFARDCRRLVYQDRKADVLANLSNDGWFIWADVPFLPQSMERERPSTQHEQHLSAYVFRAVENRVPVVRSVNTGISASIDSNGRVQAVIQRHVQGELKRAGISGAMLLGAQPKGDAMSGPRVLVDSRTTLYSIVGDALGAALAIAAAVLAGWLLLKRRAAKGTHA